MTCCLRGLATGVLLLACTGREGGGTSSDVLVMMPVPAAPGMPAAPANPAAPQAGASPPPISSDAGSMAAAAGTGSMQGPRDAGASGPAQADAAPANTPDAAAGADAGRGDRCDVAVLDPASPPRALALSGNLGTHDPALIEQDGRFYLWQTGARVPAKTSADLMRWEAVPAAFGGSNPAWVAQEVPEATDLWAPDVSLFGGLYHLYYSASRFGSNSSCIGHATRESLSAGAWQDQGPVVCSNHGSRDNWNAIDPNVVVDEAGTPWLAFGSFWSGIKAVQLTLEGARADDEVHDLATRPASVEGAIEAAFIVRRCGYYYLFVSFDKCCMGASSTYNIRVGRSEQVLGPYLDRDGVRLLDGGGTLLLRGDGRFNGPGHNAVIFRGQQAFNVYHAYDATRGGAATLRVAELAWDDDGWPVSGGP